MSPDRSVQVILNADDFGFSPAVNEAVLSAAEFGTVRAASLMVTMPFAEDAVAALWRRCPDLEIGLHFSLTCGRAAAEPGSVPLLVDSQGCFRLGFAGLLRLLTSKRREEAIRQIRREWEAQWARIEQLRGQGGFRLNHLDSHQHVHVLPGVFELLHAESANRGLHLRVPREPWGDRKRFFRRLPAWFPGGLLKREILNRYLKRHGAAAIGYFGILDSGRINRKALDEIFRAVSRRPGDGVFEINVHPSFSEDAMPEETRKIISRGEHHFHASPWRDAERKTLTDNETLQTAERYGLTLSGFPEARI